MKGQRVLLFALVGFVSFLSGGWLLQRGTDQAGNVYQQARLFDDVLGYVADYYVDSVTEAELYDLAIDGMLGQLADPYAQFLRRRDFEELTESTTGNYGGLGIRIDVRDGWITVIAPIAGTPAADAGLDTGDRIIAVDGRSTFGWKSEKAVSELRGPEGSKVTITVARPGFPEPMDLTIARAIIHVAAIQVATVIGGGDVGYVSLVGTSVSETLADELVQAVDSLRGAGAKSLILDLRYNPGGLLDQGVEVSDLFLDPGATVVSTRGRARGTTESFHARSPQRWPDMPVIVLVNHGTASASEIIAGAIQDHDRGLVLGLPTFGKGLVQTVFRLGRTEALRLTTARWYTPSGRTIQRPMVRADEAMLDDSTMSAMAGADTTEVFHTDAGREVRGGGGIRPDVVVYPDTLTEPEQEFYRALGSQLPVYRDVLTSYALELKGSGTVTDESFRVTDAMRREVIRRLEEKGVELDSDLVTGASNLVDLEMTYEIQRYVFGRGSENLRRLRDDRQVARAVEMLRQARTVPELLALAAKESPSTNMN